MYCIMSITFGLEEYRKEEGVGRYAYLQKDVD